MPKKYFDPKKTAQQHLHCRMEVRVRGPHTGLYCAEHGTWIKWISAQEVHKIKDIL
jgi:hypothetical protein